MISIQLSNARNVLLPWTILSNFCDDCTFSELYTCLKDGIFVEEWGFPLKFENFSASASIGRKKNNIFDNVLLSTSINEATKLFGHYVRITLTEPMFKGKTCSSNYGNSSNNMSYSTDNHLTKPWNLFLQLSQPEIK